MLANKIKYCFRRKYFGILLFAAVTFLAVSGFANPSSFFSREVHADYLKTLNYCKDTLKARMTPDRDNNIENGQLIVVPLDYENPSAGQTKIYTYTRQKFDPAKPTYIMVDGGPGAGSHGLVNPLPDYNLIQFDQRGTGCSPIQNESTAMQLKNYSSENTARDMDLIRKSYGINSWSVWGVSYGTVPATIYGSLFSGHSKAVVLEGVLFDNSNSGMDLLKIVNRGLLKLSSQAKNFVRQYFEGSEILFLYYEMAMRKDNGLLEVNRQIEMAAQLAADYGQSGDAVENKKTIEMILKKLNTMFLGREKASIKNKMTKNNLMEISPLVFFAINCQERPSAFAQAKRAFIVRDGILAASTGPVKQSACEKYHINPNEHVYSAFQYPIVVPVTYVQGDEDSATIMTAAIKHYQAVPKNKSQFLYVQHAGHLPLINSLMSIDSNLYRDILTNALEGQAIQKSNLADLNKQEAQADQPIQWFRSQRGF